MYVNARITDSNICPAIMALRLPSKPFFFVDEIAK